MPSSAAQPSHLDREYLPVRAKILEVAAALDRVQRANDQATDDPRWKQLQAGIKLLQTDDPERAEQVQLLFSQPYDEQWRDTFNL